MVKRTHLSKNYRVNICQAERYQKPVAFGMINICNNNNNAGMHSQVLMLLAG